MPRIARIVGVEYPHHIIQRGNNKEKVFLDMEDYERYLHLLKKYSEEKGLSILVYCLMSNHIHLLIKPFEEKSLSKMMQGVALCYTQYFNKKYRRTGRLWECRYQSTIIDGDRYLWAVSKYIENNPVRAGIVPRPEKYLYSSARAHLLGVKDGLLIEPLFEKSKIGEYKRFMRMGEEKGLLEEIRSRTRLGRPLGDGEFFKELSMKLGYDLVFRSKGRPQKGVRGE